MTPWQTLVLLIIAGTFGLIGYLIGRPKGHGCSRRRGRPGTRLISGCPARISGLKCRPNMTG